MKKNKEVRIQFGLGQIVMCFIYMSLWAFTTISYLVFIQQNATQLVVTASQKMLHTKQLKDGSAVITMQVDAIENGLGIIKVPFKIKGVLPSTPLIFKVRELGTENWYHVDAINLNHLTHLPFYPFGFPPINNSKGRIYVIEVTITKAMGSEQYAVATQEKNVQTVYQFKKSIITDDVKSLFIFVFKKYYLFIIQNYIKLIAPIITFFPIVFVLIQNKTATGHGQSFRTSVFLFLFTLSLAWATLLIYPMNDFVFSILVILWLIYSIGNNVPVVNNLIVSLVVLVVSLLFLFMRDSQLVENLSVLVYMFYAISLIQMMIQLKQNG